MTSVVEDQESAKQAIRRASSFSRQKKNRGEGGKADQDYTEDSLANPRSLSEITSPEDKLNEVVAQEAVELFDKGNYDEAGEKWWSLAEHARACGNKSQECTALHNVGTALVMMHELAEAVTCYNKALQVALEAGDKGAQVELYECLAWVYRELGHAQHAVECLNSLMMLHEESSNLNGQVLATCGLGSIHDATGNYAEAAGYYEHALELAKSAGDDKVVARVLGDLGTSYVQVSEFEKGVECYEAALKMAIAEGDRDREMRTYGNLAIAANLRERDEEAVSYFEKTIGLAQELGEPATETRARADLALVLRALGRVDEAIASLSKSVELARAHSDVVAIGEHSAQLGVTFLKHKEDAATAEEHLAKSVEAWRECAGLLRAQHCETRVSASARNGDNLETAEFFDSRLDAFVLRQLALVALGREKEALAMAEESHALATRELLALGGKDHREVGALLQAGAESQLMPVDAKLDAAAIAGIAADAHATLVMLTLTGDNEALAWVVSPDPAAELGFRKLEMSEALSAAGCTSVVHAVSRLHEAMGAQAALLECRGSPPDKEAAEAGAADADTAAASARAMLGALHAALLKPLEPLLAGARELVFLPAGVLTLIPYGALAPGGDPGAALLGSTAVCVAPSVAAFECLRKRARPAEGSQGALVVGSAQPLSSLGLKPLPHAEAEAHAVAEQLRASAAFDEPKLLLGAEAKARSVLEELVLRPPGLVHCAVHAQPKCLALTPADADAPDGSDDDGLVHKDQLHLTWLPSHPTVVLAGSHSGGGDLCEDGVLGLPRAFIAAGARAVLSSMWAVPDESAKRLLTAWYRQALSPDSPSLAAALRLATLEAAKRADGSWEEPVHWAGFTLLGNAPTL